MTEKSSGKETVDKSNCTLWIRDRWQSEKQWSTETARGAPEVGWRRYIQGLGWEKCPGEVSEEC